MLRNALSKRPRGATLFNSAGITVNRLEDKIRDLCMKIVSDEDNSEVVVTAVQLRHALQEHLKRVRARMSVFPPPVERRTAQHSSQQSESA
jgi:hypothetical protein